MKTILFLLLTCTSLIAQNSKHEEERYYADHEYDGLCGYSLHTMLAIIRNINPSDYTMSMFHWDAKDVAKDYNLVYDGTAENNIALCNALCNESHYAWAYLENKRKKK